MHRDEVGKTQLELMATKELYVNVCKVKDELEDQVRNLQSENAQTKVELRIVRSIELLALCYMREYGHLLYLFYAYIWFALSIYF